MEKAVYNWFLGILSQKASLITSMVQEKAVTFPKFDVENFHASDGLLRRWNVRNNITFKSVLGDLKSVTSDLVNIRRETFLQTLFSN